MVLTDQIHYFSLYLAGLRHYMKMNKRAVARCLDYNISIVQKHRGKTKGLKGYVLNLMKGGFGGLAVKDAAVRDIDNALIGNHIHIQVPMQKVMQPEIEK